jgi:hypothetical protein
MSVDSYDLLENGNSMRSRPLKRSTSRSKIWQKTTGSCSRDEFTPSFTTHSRTPHDLREFVPNTRTTLLRFNRRFTWYPSTFAWPCSPNRFRLHITV